MTGAMGGRTKDGVCGVPIVEDDEEISRRDSSLVTMK